MPIDLVPLIFGLAFVAATAARSLWLRVSTGFNPYVVNHQDPLLGFLAQVFAAIAMSLLAYFAAMFFWPGFEAKVGMLNWMKTDATQTASMAIMSAMIIWTSYAQFAMGNSWRIGIPDQAQPLRTDGPFSTSRNPIFLGMLVFVAGMTLWSPSAVTLTLLASSYIALEVQIRCEEAFLERNLGQPYKDYCARVRRWI